MEFTFSTGAFGIYLHQPSLDLTEHRGCPGLAGRISDNQGRELAIDSQMAEVSAWADHAADWPQSISMRATETAVKFQQVVSAYNRLNGKELTLLRYRKTPSGGKRVSDEMGPPEDHQSKYGGRYDPPGKGMLYLTDSRIGIERESNSQGLSDVSVQEYRVTGVRIADFTPEAVNNHPDAKFINLVFRQAELAGTHYEYPSYSFSQVVGSLVSDHFDGMIVRGVHGKAVDDTTYNNVVIFHPHETVGRWRDWLARDSETYEYLPPSRHLLLSDLCHVPSTF